MRERLVVTLVTMTVAMLFVFGVVRAYSTADLVKDQERSAVRRSADVAAVAIAALGDKPVTAQFLGDLTQRDQTITYVGPDGTTLRAGATSDDALEATRPVEGGGRVTLSQDSSVTSDRVSAALLPLVLLGLGLAAISAVIGSLLARRFAYPFRRLADDAIRIGNGDFSGQVHHSSMREAEDLGDALRSAAGRLDVLVRRERELAVVASHELRTPLTALRLSLEDLTLWPQTPPDVAEELKHGLAEVDRLSGVVTALLERGDGQRLDASNKIDLSTIAKDAVARWADRAAAQGRTLDHLPSAPTVTKLARQPVDRILDAVIENAIQHGTGRITVHATAAGSYVSIQVSDEGARAFDTGIVHESPAGPEAGLSDAAAEALALGGFLAIGDSVTTRVVLALPRRNRATDV
jgi:signal transduction histidine kinase